MWKGFDSSEEERSKTTEDVQAESIGIQPMDAEAAQLRHMEEGCETDTGTHTIDFQELLHHPQGSETPDGEMVHQHLDEKCPTCITRLVDARKMLLLIELYKK